jgi:hypothetical protein
MNTVKSIQAISLVGMDWSSSALDVVSVSFHMESGINLKLITDVSETFCASNIREFL